MVTQWDLNRFQRMKVQSKLGGRGEWRNTLKEETNVKERLVGAKWRNLLRSDPKLSKSWKIGNTYS